MSNAYASVGVQSEADDTAPLTSRSGSFFGRNKRACYVMIGLAAIVGAILVGLASATVYWSKTGAKDAEANNAEQACVDMGPGMFEALSTNQAGTMAKYVQVGRGMCDVPEAKLGLAMIQMNAKSFDGAFEALGVPDDVTLQKLLPVIQSFKALADATLPCCPGKQDPFFGVCNNDTAVASALKAFQSSTAAWSDFARSTMRMPADFTQLWQVNFAGLVDLIKTARTTGVEGNDFDVAASAAVANARDVGLSMDSEALSQPHLFGRTLTVEEAERTFVGRQLTQEEIDLLARERHTGPLAKTLQSLMTKVLLNQFGTNPPRTPSNTQ